MVIGTTTEVMSPRKESKKSIVFDEDRISNLPDGVIRIIVSYLPTICAVCMHILSKEWMDKWTSIHTFDVCDEKIREATFIQFMERITSHVNNVKTVHLRFFKEYDSRLVISWIYALLLRNKIEVLHLSTHFDAGRIDIPNRLLNSTSLRDMVLSRLVYSVTCVNCFTNLRSLRLEHVSVNYEVSDNDTLVFNFPVFEALQISYCYWPLHVEFVKIYAPELVTFDYERRESHFYGDYLIINVHSGRLTKFTSRGGEPHSVFVTGSKVANATFKNCTNEYEEPTQSRGLTILRLLKEFSQSLECLTLSFYAAEAIKETNQLMRVLGGVTLPSCDKLKQLVLSNREKDIITSCDPKVLLELLQAMPCLKSLYLDGSTWSDFDYEAVDSLPSCITSSLEKIELGDIYFSYTVAPLRLAKFLLKTALNLKEFHVYANHTKEFEDEIVSEILAYPTGSGCVKIAGRKWQ